MKKIFLICFVISNFVSASLNQTNDVTPIIVNGHLPFTITIESAGFMLPGGIQTGASAQYKGEYLFIAGRTNGLHGFDNTDDNFPPRQQNTTVYVINPQTKQVFTRSLYDQLSGLSQYQIDTLSVTAPQFYQSKNTLYMTGGYGVDSTTGNFSTKDTLTAIDLAGLIFWVKNPGSRAVASNYIRQISHPIFQVTGGQMFQTGKNPTLLIFGQNFQGFYTGTSNGIYTEQVRRFYIIDNGKHLGVNVLSQAAPDPSYRRRDLNVVPILKVLKNKKTLNAFVALSGVFTLAGGVWTVPVEISVDGQTFMADPTLDATFKQGMNNYNCAHADLFFNGDMYSILFGGITYGYFQDGQFLTDPEDPFTSQVTVVKRSNNGVYEQYLLNNEYPTYLAAFANPGNPLLFGAGARFMPAYGIAMSADGILNLAKIKQQTVIGYIIGGIQSTVPNTSTQADSASSPYIFQVTLTPNY